MHIKIKQSIKFCILKLNKVRIVLFIQNDSNSITEMKENHCIDSSDVLQQMNPHPVASNHVHTILGSTSAKCCPRDLKI